jgi:hypothetical protein
MIANLPKHLRRKNMQLAASAKKIASAERKIDYVALGTAS